MVLKFGSYPEEHVIHPFGNFRFSLDLPPARTASRRNVWFFHVDILELKVSVCSGHGQDTTSLCCKESIPATAENKKVLSSGFLFAAVAARLYSDVRCLNNRPRPRDNAAVKREQFVRQLDCPSRSLQLDVDGGIQFAKRFARRKLAGWILPMGESTPATPTPDIQLFRDVFNASPVGIAVEDFDGQPVFTNPAFCSFLGFSEKELRNKHCVDFSPAEDAQKDWALFQQLKAGSIDHYQLEKRYFRGDGSLVWGSLSISLLNSHPSPLVIAMVEEITDKKTVEEAVRASEKRLRLAQQIAHVGSFEWNIQTGVNTWTPELEAMYGLQPGTFAGKQTAFENLVHPD